jgi:hypothetical protein
MVFLLFHPNRMADLKLIKDLATSFIMALDKHSSSQDIIEAIEEALDDYEFLINHYNQK